MRRIVVAAAIVRGGRVLAARRCGPVGLHGYWELPGGKVEHGEDERAALARECLEELGVAVQVGALVAVQPIQAEEVLRVYRADLLRGEPRACQDHDELRWLEDHELGTLAWLPADRAVLPALAALLSRTC